MASLMTFRNDDIRNTLDDSLIELTNIFIHNNIPLTHAVEPANVTNEVVNWLIDIKNKHSDLIEIMQHGYDHSPKNEEQLGEFGGQRTYEEQFEEIKKGKDLMDEYFGNLWFKAFNFPFAPYNPAAMKAVNDVGFKVIYSHFNSRLSRRMFYKLGHLFNKGYMFKKHVSWYLDYYPGTNLFELDANLSFIRKYIDEDTSSEMFSLDELVEKTRTYLKYPTISMILHHRYHNSKDKMNLVRNYIEWCKSNSFTYATAKEIYNKFSSAKN